MACARSVVATALARSPGPVEPPRGARTSTLTLTVALALSRCHTVTLTKIPRPGPVLRTTAAARKPHGAAYCAATHPPSGPRPSTAPRPGPVALLHASPIASWWRRRPILARRNLIRQAVPKSLSRPSRSLNQTKRPLPAPQEVLPCSCFSASHPFYSLYHPPPTRTYSDYCQLTTSTPKK
ncbi:uncharacterized protein TRIVIDRAFT_66743 [Trichoderma virens Gv29-8]|uniref:Uncharacterized protein n=1 Tax=Hypocrea virens (strain Gv29-8 / FGSC 10586) TaxID=413071 RepID=G9N319_HYPVG|nr:uncharacterized protein TRIVIDRAFT_66743 [Trichoderma virens Gv29-8]EHK18704.1 hypothetical protein TRIVIDRAFT_66743 [Trichoderma virens Gv29-8]